MPQRWQAFIATRYWLQPAVFIRPRNAQPGLLRLTIALPGKNACRKPGCAWLVMRMAESSVSAAFSYLASLILADLLDLAAAMGAKKITVDASETARGFFEKHGFKLLGSGEQSHGEQRLACHHLVRA